MTRGAGQERTARNRDRLLDAAVTAFAERGFHGTSTRDIAAAAGMSPAAVYVHHKSKEELLYLISRTGHEQTLALLREAIAKADEPAGQLAAAVRAFVAFHAEEHTMARIINYELAALSDDHLREIAALRRAITDEVRALVERGVAAGVFDTGRPRMAAIAVLSLGVDAARWYRDEGAWSPEDVAAYYVDLAMRIVGADRPA